jgi:hypothetical protein
LPRPALAELLDQPDTSEVDRQNGGAGILFDDPVDAGVAIGTQELVFAEAKPLVPVDLARGESEDFRAAGGQDLLPVVPGAS